jgi:hypothetical protein
MLEKIGIIPADEIAEIAALKLPEEGMKPVGTKKARPVRPFVSYSHENAAWCKRLHPMLRVRATSARLA